MEAPSLVPNVDVELIPLPFLLFANSRLRTANAGARVLLGLLDANLESYTFEAVFPPSLAGPPDGSKLKAEGHLQMLRAKVQSSQEQLKLKAAVYNSESDGSLRSILIVDVSLLPLPPSPLLSNASGRFGGHTHALEQNQHHTAQPSIPKMIKRHSGDIRKIFGHERRKSQVGPSHLQEQQQSETPSNVGNSGKLQAPQQDSPIKASSSHSRRASEDLSNLKQGSSSSPSLPPIISRGSDSTQSSASAKSKSSARSSLRFPTAGAGHTAELAQAALAVHPRTGVIISRNDLSSGFINSRTRELLMGIKSPEHEGCDPFDDQFVSPASARLTHLSQEQEDFSPAWEDQIDFEGDVRIDLPDRGINLQTSVSDILRWSLKRKRARQHHRSLRDNASIRSGPSLSSATSTSGSIYGASSSMGDASTVIDSLDNIRPWLAHKPYKCYDTSFSQRVEDPFEALFDTCIRKGQRASEVSIMVGVETEVGRAETCAFPESECFTYISESTDPNSPRELMSTRVRRRIVNARAAPLHDLSGNHIGGVVWLRDFTGESMPSLSTSLASSKQYLKDPHEAAQKHGFHAPSLGGADSDPFWQHIVNSMPHMVWVTKPDGEHIYFNDKWYAYTGLQPEQSLGVNWQNPFHPDEMPASRRAWSRSLATGEPYSTEYRCRRHDGAWRWQLGRAQALRDANGKIVAWMGSCTDVEEFIQMRTQLAETSQNLRRVIELANITLLCVDKNLKVLFMEGGGTLKREGSGQEASSIEGKSLSEVIASPLLEQKALAILGGAENARVEISLRPGVYIGCHLTPLRHNPDEAPSGVVIVAGDITDLKEAEAALKHSYEEQTRLLASETAAKEASRLKSEFTANLSHEIRTPITGMIGMSELLLEEDMPPEQHENLKKILKSGEILLKMVGDVLDIGKVEAGKLELDILPFALQDLVSDATAMLRVAASKKGLQFNEDLSNLFEGEVMGDLPRLRQVLLNFLANSVKFTKHGFINLRVRQDEETATSIRVRIVVEDSGIGIDEKVIPTLFQAFQQADSTTSREHGGTGLGLAISKRLVELMHGHVQLDSKLGKGTKVTVTVPLTKNPRPTAGPVRRLSQRPGVDSSRSITPTFTIHAIPPSLPVTSATSAPSVLPSPAKEIVREDVWILLAEDNPLNAEIFEKSLRRMKFNVQRVSNGREAVKAMEERRWDIALMDCHMPVCDGYEATKIIRQSEDPVIRNTTIIALTASAIAGDKERCLSAGMDAYLSKPVRLKLLEETVMQHLQQRQSLPTV